MSSQIRQRWPYTSRTAASGPDPRIRERLALRIGLAEDRKRLRVAQVVIEAIGDVEIVGEKERAASERARSIARARRIEHARHQHRRLDGGREQGGARRGVATQQNLIFGALLFKFI